MYIEIKKILGLACFACATAWAETLPVDTLHIVGPFSAHTPLLTDTADVWGKAFDLDKEYSSHIHPRQWTTGKVCPQGVLPPPQATSISLLGFEVENTMFVRCKVNVKAHSPYQIFVNGREGAEQSLTPGRHQVVIRLRQQANQADTVQVSVDTEQGAYLTLNPQGRRLYTLEDYMHGERVGHTQLSSSGRYMVYHTTTTRSNGQSETNARLLDTKTMTHLPLSHFMQWASRGDRYIRHTRGNNMEHIYEYVHPQTGEVQPLGTVYHDREGYFLPGEQFLMLTQVTEGPKEDKKIYQIIEPDDRMPGWRNRTNPQLLDIKTGQIIPLTLGGHNVQAQPTDEGNKVLLSIRENCITERPFAFVTVLLLDRTTQQVDTLVHRDGFLNEARWTADGKQVLLTGSPEAFSGIGKNDSTGKIPSMIQTELYLMDPATKQVKSLTYDFNPNIASWQVSRADGNVYALCENHDRKDIFRLDMKKQQWSRLKLTENAIANFSLATEKPVLSYTGQSDSNSDRVYRVDLTNEREQLLVDLDAVRMKDVGLGSCQEWNFQSSRGDTIYGRYYLPPHFDPNKKYPMLVYYYGGCSPVGRALDSYYNFHGWAAMNYVVYVVQPSGCTGFGQEFAARHVNAYGKYTAQDIIEGTQQFCQEHPYVNTEKIGCLGASYGGFMTMYLLTQTRLFAAAMAHAGISNPASYWGYGYWGYSYSAISAAHSYPWNNAELLSGDSPLFNADKIHTPLLLLHGSADTNVPLNESIQMFNALKILGRECAFVVVDGQNHHILDYEKRIKWIHTYYAWFAKWLHDDPTWWESLYPKKNLK